MLEVLNVTKSFGGLKAVDNCSITVRKTGICGLIGPNGSGKSTLFNLITGYYRPDSGKIFYNGSDLGKVKPYEIANMGLSRTFQLTHLFKRMTIMENMLIAPKLQEGENIWKALLGRNVKKQEHVNYEKAMEHLEFFGITHLRNEYADSISFGQQKLLEMARTLMTGPDMILMDEPTGGVNPVLINKIIDHIRELRDMGITFLIVEHNMSVVSELCDEVYVLDYGKNIARGNPDEVRNDECVIDAYLGAEHVT
ncbi:MAG: ABC transporter ATP-binding protein [Methanosarcinaceae archaeon]